MTKNINFVSHKKSKVKLDNGKPQLPLASALVEGEIAINYAENVETLSIKNESGSVVTFSSDNYYKEQYLAWEKGEGVGSAKIVGNSGVTTGNFTVSEGYQTSAITTTDNGIHAEGYQTLAITNAGGGVHAEGYRTVASGQGTHVEGFETSATTQATPGVHAEGFQTLASEGGAHAEGTSTSALTRNSHAEGNSTLANGISSHSEGTGTKASGSSSHAEGTGTSALTDSSHAEGYGTKANGNYGSHAEGQGTVASGNSSHAEGYITRANGIYSHAEGNGTSALTDSSHAEGNGTVANGNSSHAEGNETTASGSYSHSEGNDTTASGGYGSHAEGIGTVASGNYGSHAEGQNTLASGDSSHAEGTGTSATTENAHAEGYYTLAKGLSSHAEGKYTIANNNYEHASGQYNVSSSATSEFGDSGNTLFSVGNGTADDARHNAFEIRQNGDIYIVSGNTDIKLQDHIGGGGSITVDQVIDSTTSASTNPVATKAVYDAITENELVWANAYVAISGALSSHTEDMDVHLTPGEKASLSEASGITSLNGYEIASSASSISTTDTLIQAIGKLEKRIALLEAALIVQNNGDVYGSGGDYE